MYAAMTKDEGNEADGRFSAACGYFNIGKWVEESSLQHCQGRRLDVLGGYDRAILG